ncbi:MAG: hypothetical protein QOI31_2584 [Solirubrobacterales bacterium]|jgi:hypothetical protein|nr:hypothetical protein [Solirubrobacterales bacterium]
MGFEFYPPAWEVAIEDDLPKTPRLVLLAVVEHADVEGQCFPSQKRLALFTGLSERAVRNALRELEERGVIERKSRGSDKGGRTSDLITLRIPKRERSAAIPVGVRTELGSERGGVTGRKRLALEAGGAGEPHTEPKGNEEKECQVIAESVPDTDADSGNIRSGRSLLDAHDELVAQGEAEWLDSHSAEGLIWDFTGVENER